MEPSSGTKISLQSFATESLITFSGECELLQATWDLSSGRTVELRILEKPGIDRVNPFKQYTRRRNGHAGQLFAMAISEVGNSNIVYSSDGMLAGWGDSHDKGQWVKFWLDEEADRHPFAGYRRRHGQELGQFFMVALVLLDSEGNAIDPTAEHLAEAAAESRKGRTISQQAHLMITGSMFVQYLREKSSWTKTLIRQGREWDADLARRYVKWFLKIESLSDLDRYPEKEARFHREIREPFSKWSGSNE